jgi:2-octaprenylphenol hydroxylase
MPLPSNIGDSSHTVVWSVDNEKLDNQNIEQYVNEYMSYFEGKLSSEIKVNSGILSFKLFNHHFKNYVSGSTVLIGDAAHSIHPLAGQGINLGFADADAFCEEIINGFEKSINIDQRLVLKRYEVRRKNMNLLMLKSMDFFVNLFNSNNLYLKLLRNTGLSRVNKTQFLKKFLISHASGKNKI